MDTPRYPFVHVDVPSELADDATALLFELGAGGVEERDESTLAKSAKKGSVTLVAAFASREEADAACGELDSAWSPRVEEIVGDAWRDAWKEHYHPFALTDSITVRPPWEAYEAKKPGEKVLELEPGRAFGTGLHATTSLVAKALEREKARLAGATVLDVGTGSGILAIVALALGAARAIAIDVDPDAIAVTKENAARNGVDANIDASTKPVQAVDGTFPIVLANIEARVLIPLAGAIGAKVAKGGLLVLSGILVGQEDDVAHAYPDFRLERTDREGEWVSLVLSR